MLILFIIGERLITIDINDIIMNEQDLKHSYIEVFL